MIDQGSVSTGMDPVFAQSTQGSSVSDMDVLRSLGDLISRLISNNGSVSGLLSDTAAQQDILTLMNAFRLGGSSGDATTQASASLGASRSTAGGASSTTSSPTDLLNNLGRPS
ncbi:MAG: hypothetical protein CMH16_22455 [Methylobacterium sp.]|nr:hypothetical protein [Methylobacterium sp.]